MNHLVHLLQLMSAVGCLSASMNSTVPDIFAWIRRNAITLYIKGYKKKVNIERSRDQISATLQEEQKRQLYILRLTTSTIRAQIFFLFKMHTHDDNNINVVRERIFFLSLMFVNTAWMCQPLLVTKSSTCLLSCSALGVRTTSPGDTCFVCWWHASKKEFVKQSELCCVIERRQKKLFAA